jgi:hypothetical protein
MIKDKIQKWIVDTVVHAIPEHYFYDQVKSDQYLEEKEAFNEGVEYFNSKNYKFPPDLIEKLKRESGLAFVARKKNHLLPYAVHCYKQVELVYSSFFNNSPGRGSIGTFLLNGENITLNNYISVTNTASQSNLLYNQFSIPRANSNQQPQLKCLLRKLLYVQEYRGAFSVVSTARQRDRKWRLTSFEQDRIFKSTLYFNPIVTGSVLSTSAQAIQNKPYLYAIDHMYHCRNMGSHLNTENKRLYVPSFNGSRELNRYKIFYDTPEVVLNINKESPGFYQRYVDMVLFLYSEYLKNAHF